MIRAISHVVAVLLLVAYATGATRPDMFEKLGSVSFEHAVSFENKGDDIYLLLENSVALIHAGDPGNLLLPTMRTELQQSYQHTYLCGNWLYLYSPGGQFGVVRVLPDTLISVAELAINDSTFSVAASGRYLYFATGSTGIAIFDSGDKTAPAAIGKADHGGYYNLLKVYDSLLFAIDILNGIDVYRIRDSSLSYQSTILTQYPVSDLIFYGNSLFACYGQNLLSKWNLSDVSHPQFVADRQFDRTIQFLTNSDEKALVGFERGLVQRLDLQTALSGGDYQVGYPLKKMATTTSVTGTAFIVLDAVGQLSLLRADGDSLTLAKHFSSSAQPSAIAATDGGVVVASPGKGLYLLDFNSGIASERLLYENSQAFSCLVGSDSLIFAANANSQQVDVFELTDNLAHPIAEISTTETILQLFVLSLGSDNYQAVAIGANGADAVAFSSNSAASTPLWQIRSSFIVTSGYCDERSLALASEAGDIELYCLDCNFPSPNLLGRLSRATAPRALLVVDGKYLVSGGKSGLSVDKYDNESLSFRHLTDLISVTSVADLAYDSLHKLLLVAGGEFGLKYLDFSQPESLGVVYSVPFSQGATTLSIRGDHLYGVGSSALNAFIRIDDSAHHSQLPIAIRVSECFPNPFNGGTNIEISQTGGVLNAGKINYQIYNILGQLVREDVVATSQTRFRIFWDGTSSAHQSVSSGVYFFRLAAAGRIFTRKMLLLK